MPASPIGRPDGERRERLRIAEQARQDDEAGQQRIRPDLHFGQFRQSGFGHLSGNAGGALGPRRLHGGRPHAGGNPRRCGSAGLIGRGAGLAGGRRRDGRLLAQAARPAAHRPRLG
jgi:hypothetical protein